MDEAPMKAKLLVVEDEATARELLVRGLRRAGYEAVGVADGEQALAHIQPDHDIVITDIAMPRLDGLRLLEELQRVRHPAQRVVVTSFADKANVLAALNHGADYLLEKPFGIERLCSVVERLARAGGAPRQQLDTYYRRRLAELPVTARERELIELVLRGDSNKQIALRLGITEQSVKNGLSKAYSVLRIQSRGELFHLVFPIGPIAERPDP
jgi:DNA-binding NarL/FixJ family response regulator